VIVDPGVGSPRSLLAIYLDDHFFVGPDNGIFTPLMSAGHAPAIHRITESNLFLKKISNTFHGRDILAPVAARLATGLPIDRVGPRIRPEDCQLSDSRACSIIDGVLRGEITHIDRFGNLCTNISRNDVEGFRGNKKLSIQLEEDGELPVDTVGSSYAGQGENTLLALYDSHDFLEIAENQGNAAQRLRSSIGSRVLLFVK
jgi:hypothetical protein